MKIIPQIAFFILINCFQSLGQTQDSSQTNRLGAMAIFDLGLNFSDPVFNTNSERRFSVGAAYTNKQKKFVCFLGVGARLLKATIRTPQFTPSFLDDLNDNYTPINEPGFDSLVGADMSGGGSFWNTAGGWLYSGFTWNTKFRPTVSFYWGTKGINSYGNGFTKYTDPVYGDIQYASLGVQYYELKLGCSPPFIGKKDWPFNATLNFGYRLSDYGGFYVDHVPMSSYTNANFVNKYRFTHCFTLSLSVQFWSNW